MRPQPGDLINGKYRVLRLIGDGGMGSVYEARHEYLGTTVALKFLHPELSRRPGLVQRFLREAQVSANIHSPHVAHVTDVDQASDGSAYLVMELLVGESLQQVLERLGRLPRDLALDYTLQMLSGLEAAHAAGVVHRDLKPDNVFVVGTPQGPVVKVLDFGIAKLRNSREFQVGLTRPGVVMGTPEYMAPEQAESADRVDARADIYAVGAILYEMLSGRRPAHGDDARSIAAMVRAELVTPLRTLDPSIPEGLAGTVHRAMAPNPEHRYATVGELRDALAAYCGAMSAAGRLAATPTSPSAGAPITSPGGPPAASSGVAPTLPPGDPGRSTPVDVGPPPTGFQPFGGTAAMRPMQTPPGYPPTGFGSTSPMPPMQVAPAASAPALFSTAPTPQGARSRSGRGLTIGVLAALAGAAIAILVIVAVSAQRSDDGPRPHPTATAVTTVAPVPPTATVAPTVGLPIQPAATATAQPAATAKLPAKPHDGGVEGFDAGVAPMPTFPQLPFPLPSGLPPIQIPSALPFPIPGFPLPAPAASK